MTSTHSIYKEFDEQLKSTILSYANNNPAPRFATITNISDDENYVDVKIGKGTLKAIERFGGKPVLNDKCVIIFVDGDFEQPVAICNEYTSPPQSYNLLNNGCFQKVTQDGFEDWTGGIVSTKNYWYNKSTVRILPDEYIISDYIDITPLEDNIDKELTEIMFFYFYLGEIEIEIIDKTTGEPVTIAPESLEITREVLEPVDSWHYARTHFLLHDHKEVAIKIINGSSTESAYVDGLRLWNPDFKEWLPSVKDESEPAKDYKSNRTINLGYNSDWDFVVNQSINYINLDKKRVPYIKTGSSDMGRYFYSVYRGYEVDKKTRNKRITVECTINSQLPYWFGLVSLNDGAYSFENIIHSNWLPYINTNGKHELILEVDNAGKWVGKIDNTVLATFEINSKCYLALCNLSPDILAQAVSVSRIKIEDVNIDNEGISPDYTKVNELSYDTNGLKTSHVFGTTYSGTTVERYVTDDNKLCIGGLQATGYYYPSGKTKWIYSMVFEKVHLDDTVTSQRIVSIEPKVGSGNTFRLRIDNDSADINDVPVGKVFTDTMRINRVILKRDGNTYSLSYLDVDGNIVSKSYTTNTHGTYVYMQGGGRDTVNILEITRLDKN